MKTFIAFIVCLTIFAYMLSAPAQNTPPPTATVMVVSTTQVTTGAIQSVALVHGKAVPREDVTVSSEVAGSAVLEVVAEEGNYVEKGQVLARLDTARLQYSLHSLTADLAMAKEEFIRVEHLKTDGAISKDELGKRRAAYMVLKAQVADATLQLQKAIILAPASGIVYERNVTIGEISQVGQPFFKIAANGEIELEVAVPEIYAHALTKETKVEATLSSSPVQYPARIRILSPRIDHKTRTAQVRLVLTSPAPISVGTFCSAKFWLPAQKGLVVLSTAVQHDSSGTYVWQVQPNNTVTRKNVTVVAQSDSNTLITGLPEKTIVIAKAGAFLQEGDSIQPVNEAAR